MQADQPREQWKLAQPLNGAVVTILGFFGGLIIAVPLISTLVSSASFSIGGFGPGARDACEVAPQSGLTMSGNSDGVIQNMKAGTSQCPYQFNICAAHPTTGQRVLVTLAQLPSAVFYLAILVLLWYLVRAFRDGGPFALRVAGRLRFLGWFIFAGSLVVAAAQALASNLFIATTLTGQWPTGHFPVLENTIDATVRALFNPTPLLIGCGLLTLARVIRVGAQMNDDIAGTV
jgi:hypothetical protein